MARMYKIRSFGHYMKYSHQHQTHFVRNLNISQMYCLLLKLSKALNLANYQHLMHNLQPLFQIIFPKLAYFQSAQLLQQDDWHNYRLLINKLMKASKNPFSTIYHGINTHRRNQKIVKASDIKLNDVLINGVQLNCYKVVKNKRISLPRKHHFQERQEADDCNRDSSFAEEDNLFKNNAIKRRLRSLESEVNPFLKTTYEPFSPKRMSLHANNYKKVPIQILKPLPRQKSQELQNSAVLPQSFRFIDVNQKYYSLLKKQLAMSTNKHFNSTIVKHKAPLGKYIGLKAEKLKRNITDRDSNLIPRASIKIDKKMSDRNRYESTEGKEIIHLDPEESNKSFQYQYPNLQAEQREQIDEDSKQKLIICYSTKHKFKRWKDSIVERATSLEQDESKQSEANLEYKNLLSSTIE